MADHQDHRQAHLFVRGQFRGVSGATLEVVVIGEGETRSLDRAALEQAGRVWSTQGKSTFYTASGEAAEEAERDAARLRRSFQ